MIFVHGGLKGSKKGSQAETLQYFVEILNCPELD